MGNRSAQSWQGGRQGLFVAVAAWLLPALLSLSLYGQSHGGAIRGQVVDTDGLPLPGATIVLQGTVMGTSADEDGYFVLEDVPPGTFRLRALLLGYYPVEKEVQLGPGERLDVGRIVLRASPLPGEAIVVTASKYEQNIQEVPATLVTVDRAQIFSRHLVRLDQALRYIPGVYLNGSQINIRGSSGYSLGVGSRVLLLVDGMPLMTGDTREVNFDAVPIQMVERVEVFKGAGSALYGSSALGGVINVITRSIPEKNQVYLRTYGAVYSHPYYRQWRWSERRRTFNGQQALVALGGESLGLMVSALRHLDDGYKQNGWRRSWRFTGKFSWQLSPYQQLTLFSTHLTQKRGNFLYWRDLNHALQPPPAQLDDWVKSRRTYLQTQYRHILASDRFLVLRLVWFHNVFQDNVATGPGNRSSSDHYESELQYAAQYGRHYLTLGGSTYLSRGQANIFGEHESRGGALYIQDELHWNHRVILNLGARWDVFDMDSVGRRQRLNPKLGLVYSPARGTALRASLGSGFRAPSVAEVFTSTDVSGLQVRPNPRLKPERSLSSEVGWNQHLGREAVLDVALFYNRYWDLIEGRVDPTSGVIQFQNVTRARILGAETSVSLQLFNQRLKLQSAYTIVDARDLDADDFLFFRPRHLWYNSGQLRLGPFTVAADYRFISKYERIDPSLRVLVPDVDVRNDAHVVDARVHWDFRLFGEKSRISLEVNNLLQYHYLDRVGSLAPIRHFVLTLEVGN
ncbi:MAG: TonB-dependent receptor [Calditrichaeota bacterium]|nr:MAG: TonB-dependent receptor [Calditrichota bacterium]